jgi:hypothetical protein
MLKNNKFQKEWHSATKPLRIPPPPPRTFSLILLILSDIVNSCQINVVSDNFDAKSRKIALSLEVKHLTVYNPALDHVVRCSKPRAFLKIV